MCERGPESTITKSICGQRVSEISGLTQRDEDKEDGYGFGGKSDQNCAKTRFNSREKSI